MSQDRRSDRRRPDRIPAARIHPRQPWFDVQSGAMRVARDDGTETDLKAGDAYVIDPGHDAWITGDGRFVAFESESRAAEEYARE